MPENQRKDHERAGKKDKLAAKDAKAAAAPVRDLHEIARALDAPALPTEQLTDIIRHVATVLKVRSAGAGPAAPEHCYLPSDVGEGVIVMLRGPGGFEPDPIYANVTTEVQAKALNFKSCG